MHGIQTIVNNIQTVVHDFQTVVCDFQTVMHGIQTDVHDFLTEVQDAQNHDMRIYSNRRFIAGLLTVALNFRTVDLPAELLRVTLNWVRVKNCQPKIHQGDNSSYGKSWGDNSSCSLQNNLET